jgi:hypothetical protein
MSDDNGRITAAKLRIVTKDGEPVAAKRTAPAKQPKRRFAQVNINRLRDPLWQRKFAASTRLYFLLQYLTRRGARSWTLTNDDAAIVGLERRHKHESLRELEADGLVQVARKGQRNPEVTLLRPGLL